MERLLPVAVALWLGAALALNFGAPPAVFRVAPDSTTAGTVAGAVLGVERAVALVLLPLLAAGCLLWTRRGAGRLPMLAGGCLLVALALVVADHLLLTPRIAALREEMTQVFGSVSTTPRDHDLRRTFGALHGASMVRALLECLLGIAALAALLRQRPPA